jgi:hypothetical protein
MSKSEAEGRIDYAYELMGKAQYADDTQETVYYSNGAIIALLTAISRDMAAIREKLESQ